MKNEMSMLAVDKFPILMVLKEVYTREVNELAKTELLNIENESEWIELYHGTTSLHLQKILKEGLKPNELQVNMWNNEVPPMKNVVYLTDTWHHFFASTAYNHHLEATSGMLTIRQRRYDIEQHVSGKKVFKGVSEDFPVVLKVKVPKALLVADEDFFLSKFMNDKVTEGLKKRGIVIPEYNPDDENSIREAFMDKMPTDKEFFDELGFSDKGGLGQKSLEFNGTVAHYGTITPENILEIACYPSMKTLEWSMFNRDKQVNEAFHYWQSGFGKEKMTNKMLSDFEKTLPRIDAKFNKGLLNIEKIVVDYDKKKTKSIKNGVVGE